LTFILIFDIICFRIKFTLNKQANNGESPLDTNVVIFIFCLIGCGVHCWRLGKMEGIEGTVQYFIDEGYLDIEEPDVE